METKDYVLLFGFVVTLALGLINLWHSITNNRRTTYINSITSERVKWRNTLRDNPSSYISEIYAATSTGEVKTGTFHVSQNADKLHYLIKLQLNGDGTTDGEMIALLERIHTIKATQPQFDLSPLLEKLTQLCQQLLRQEWSKVKEEAVHGDLRYSWSWKFTSFAQTAGRLAKEQFRQI